MSITYLLPPEIHAAHRRIRELTALRTRINNELKELRAVVEPYVPPDERLGGKPVPPQPPCGSEKAYQWHRRFGPRDEWPLPVDDPCGCRAAHTASERARRTAKALERQYAAQHAPTTGEQEATG